MPAVPFATGCSARIVGWDMPHLGLFHLVTQGEQVFRILEQWTAKSGLVRLRSNSEDRSTTVAAAGGIRWPRAGAGKDHGEGRRRALPVTAAAGRCGLGRVSPGRKFCRWKPDTKQRLAGGARSGRCTERGEALPGVTSSRALKLGPIRAERGPTLLRATLSGRTVL